MPITSLFLSPPVLLGTLLVAAYASIFHLWTGRSLRELPQFLLVAGVGFLVGHWVSETLQWETLRIGQLSFVEATLASILALILMRIVLP